MNFCDYTVKEVMGKPTKKVVEGEGYYAEWWEVEVSYIYDNGKEVEKALTFDTEEEAKKVKKGYEFLA